MVIDITRAYFSEMFRNTNTSTTETSLVKWLDAYAGPRLEEPNIEIDSTGVFHRIELCGDGWVIDHQVIKIPNPVKRHEHNVGVCAPLGPWSPTISTSHYRLHINDDALAVQFKLRWL